MDALLGLFVTIGLIALFVAPFWVLLVWVPAGGCRCRYADRHGYRLIFNPSCPRHGGSHAG